jgi:protocatechuate 3,4-dioxygenase beta subunit
MSKLVLIILTLLVPNYIMASVPVDGMVSQCSPYPVISNRAQMPLKFNTTNNLTVDVSGFYNAEGQKITIYGRVMDAACVPISDAKIYIWQVNKSGYVQYQTQAKGASKPKWVDPNFNGTGISNSDNMGRFNFTTIMPGSYSHYTPHINIMIEHPTLKTLYSKVYFPREVGEKIKDAHSINNTKIATQVSAVLATDNENTYFIDVTIRQSLPHREY